MTKALTFLLTGLMCAIAAMADSGSDWNQWRGPQRNGVLPVSPPLANAWPTNGPRLLWESEPIPGDDDGGHGSPVVAGSRVYLSLAWHTNVPSETRTINDLVMRQLGHQGTGTWSKDLVNKMEATREGIPPTLRGKKLDEFTDKWIEENLDKKQKQLFNGFVRNRFKKGKYAIPLPDYDKLVKAQDKPFENDAAMRKWLDDQGFSDFVKQQVIEAVPPSKRVAEDMVICLDLATGKTLWKAAVPGEPKGRICSSTAAVADGKVFAMGSTNLFAVDVASGRIAWTTPLPAKAPGSSPLVTDGVVVVNAGKLTAYDATKGKQLWQQPKVGGGNSSPSAWKKDGRTAVLCNARNELTAVDLKTGNVLWITACGGDSTPAILGDMLVVQSKNPKIGLLAVKLTLEGAESRWTFPMDVLRNQSSPIIHDGHVYLMDDGNHYCFNLADGKVAWRQPVPSSISSPVLADGKVFVMLNNGNNIQMLKALPTERAELGKANVRALPCPSPAIAQGRLVVRLKDRLRCYDLTEGGKLSAQAE